MVGITRSKVILWFLLFSAELPKVHIQNAQTSLLMWLQDARSWGTAVGNHHRFFFSGKNPPEPSEGCHYETSMLDISRSATAPLLRQTKKHGYKFCVLTLDLCKYTTSCKNWSLLRWVIPYTPSIYPGPFKPASSSRWPHQQLLRQEGQRWIRRGYMVNCRNQRQQQ